MVYVVVLNWNGWKDTLECMDSVFKSDYKDVKIIVVDNNSSDDSLIKINSFIETNGFQHRVYIIANNENSGFSKGCNIGIDYSMKQADCEYIWLLNNDTEIEIDTISNLINFYKRFTNYSVITPQINYFDNKELIWNCGGRISKLGFRKYFYPKENEAVLPRDKEFFNVSFLTNCASFFKREFFENGYRLNERFFFGEEDFSLSLYAKKNKLKMACIISAKIYHKVSSSIQKQSNKDENRYFIHYMNRLIDMKLFYDNSLIFGLYVKVYLVYLRKLLGLRISDFNKFRIDLLKAVNHFNSVSKETFEYVMKNGYHIFVEDKV